MRFSFDNTLIVKAHTYYTSQKYCKAHSEVRKIKVRSANIILKQDQQIAAVSQDTLSQT